jgi:hypothetical protein
MTDFGLSGVSLERFHLEYAHVLARPSPPAPLPRVGEGRCVPLAREPGEGAPQGRERARHQEIAEGLSYAFRAKKPRVIT